MSIFQQDFIFSIGLGTGGFRSAGFAISPGFGQPFRSTGSPFPVGSAETIFFNLLKAIASGAFSQNLEQARAVTSPFLTVAEQTSIEELVAAEAGQESAQNVPDQPGSSPYVPHLPGQQPVGYDLNFPYLPGSSADPGGPIDPRLAWPTQDRILDVLDALGIEVPDMTDPRVRKEVIKEVALYWVGRALANHRQRAAVGEMSRAQRRADVQRQLEIQAYFMSLRAQALHLFGPQTVAEVRAHGVDTSMPSRPEPPCVRICDESHKRLAGEGTLEGLAGETDHHDPAQHFRH